MNEIYNKMKYFEETEKIPAKIYYHYTSLDALFNIVKTKTFRLTSLESSNDKKELNYKPEKFIIDLENLCTFEKNQDLKRYFQIILDSIKSNQDKFLKECRKTSNSYALCLSEKKDNLTHWDRYAAGCTGVCIAFNISSINVYLQRMALECFGTGLYDVGHISYTSNQTEEKIRTFTQTFIDMLNEFSNIKNEINEILKKKWIYIRDFYLQANHEVY